MSDVQILRVRCDHVCLRSKRLKGHSATASLARRLFLNTPGICSFEVSPYSGEVVIGFDTHILGDDTLNLPAMSLLHKYFPELLSSRRFQYFRTHH